MLWDMVALAWIPCFQWFPWIPWMDMDHGWAMEHEWDLHVAQLVQFESQFVAQLVPISVRLLAPPLLFFKHRIFVIIMNAESYSCMQNWLYPHTINPFIADTDPCIPWIPEFHRHHGLQSMASMDYIKSIVSMECMFPEIPRIPWGFHGSMDCKHSMNSTNWNP